MAMISSRAQTLLAVLALVGVVAPLACSQPSEAPNGGERARVEEGMSQRNAGPVDATQARTLFQRFVSDELPSTPGQEVEKAQAAELVAQPPMPPNVQREPIRSYARRVRSIIGSGARASELILHGDLARLESDETSDRECFSIHYTAMLTPGVAGCVDTESGRLLLVWVTPEG